MSTLLSSPVLDNPSESRRSFASSAFIDDVNAELEAEAQHYEWFMAREAEPAPLTPETAVEAIERSIPDVIGVSIYTNVVKSSGVVRTTYSVHAHLRGTLMFCKLNRPDLDSAVAEVIADANKPRPVVLLDRVTLDYGDDTGHAA